MPFDTDFEAADDLLAEAFGASVTIERTGSPPTAAVAEVILRDYEVTDDESGLTVTVQSRDYLIAAADYKVGGMPVTPRPGDKIQETIAGALRTFEVLPVGDRPCAEWADAGGSRWLIHTKQVA